MKINNRRISAILAIAIVLSLFAAFPAFSAGAEIANIAPRAQYKGEGDDNGTSGSYCEVGAEWNQYHSGKLNDKTVASDASNTVTGINVEFFNDSYAYGVNQLTFKFDYEVYVDEIVAYFNTRTNSENRGYPTSVKVYVGNSEDVAEAVYFGEATTESTDYVRPYTVSGTGKGRYVIFEIELREPVTVVALSEVMIFGFGVPAEPILPNLSAPVLSGNLSQLETFTAPTITWEPVEGAVSYDAYINGVLVTEGITETSYVPDMEPVINYAGNTDYTKVQIVAKGDCVEFADSALSDSYNFFYVAKPVDLRGNKVESADILIDPGHGGSQPGACGVYPDGSERQEKVDTLAMSLKLGEYFEKLGYTVAYTRITDSDVGLMARAAMANAGTFRAYICVHRNSFTDARANGIETLYQTGDANDQALAKCIQDEMMKLGGFTDRGLKPRDNLVVLNNTSAKTPLCLVELAFISNEKDNTTFDEKFDDLAAAIVKGTMYYLGDDPAANGKIVFGETEHTYNGEEIVIDMDVYVGDEVSYEAEIELSNRLGITAMNSVINGESNVLAFDYLPTVEDVKAGDAITCSLNFTVNTDEAKQFTASVTYTDKLGGVHTLITVNVNVTEKPYIVGDIDNDGLIDNTDASIILKYDAGIITEMDDTALLAGDVDGDGAVDNTDAALILKYDAGLIESF